MAPVAFCRKTLTTRAEVGSRKRKNGTLPPEAPSFTTWKSPEAVRSCWAAPNVLRTKALEPAVALSESCAASAPVRTIVLWMAAVPSPAVVGVLHAPKSPDSKPSPKTVAALALPAQSSSTKTAATGIPITRRTSVVPRISP